MAPSPDGRYVLSCSTDGSVRLWDRAATEPRRVLAAVGVYVVAPAPTGPQVFTGAWDGVITCWDLPSGRPIRTFAGHQDTVFALAVSADGRTLASGGQDGTVRVWTL